MLVLEISNNVAMVLRYHYLLSRVARVQLNWEKETEKAKEEENDVRSSLAALGYR